MADETCVTCGHGSHCGRTAIGVDCKASYLRVYRYPGGSGFYRGRAECRCGTCICPGCSVAVRQEKLFGLPAEVRRMKR